MKTLPKFCFFTCLLKRQSIYFLGQTKQPNIQPSSFMLSLSPTLANRETPRNLSAIPPSVRRLPPSLQVIALCDMLADAREQRNDRNATVRDLRQRLTLAEQACGRALRQFDTFAQLVRIRDKSLFNSVCETLSHMNLWIS